MKIRVRYRNNTGELTAGFVRLFRISTTVLAMLVVALLSALVTMRLAIHAGEVEVPSVSGMTLEEAADKANTASLNITVESRFYSTIVPAGRVLSQSPAAGSSVRKGWHMRVTESMGPQRVTIPDTVGMDEREAGMAIRRASLDLGALAHMPAPGAPDTVLAQTPPANAEGVDKPEISLLLSQPETSAPKAYVMPNLVGLSFSGASAKMREIDMRLYALLPQATPSADGTPAPAASPAGVVLTQTPAAGMRVAANETPRVKMSSYTAAPAATTPDGTTPSATTTPGSTTAPAAKPATPAAPIVRQPPAATPSTTPKAVPIVIPR